MEQMNRIELTNYITNVFKLETSLHSQKALCQNIEDMIKEINSSEKRGFYPERPTKGIITGFWKENTGLFVFLFVLISVIGLSNSIFHTINNFPSVEMFLHGAMFGVIASFMIISICVYYIKRHRINTINSYISFENVVIELENRKSEILNDKKIEILTQELEKLGNLKDDTNSVLKKYYDLNIISSEYRYFEAVGWFYEYFSTERCSSLQGSDGAYEIFEKELSEGKIINKKFSDISESLETTNNDRHLLYTALKNSHAWVDKVTESIKSIITDIDCIYSMSKVNDYIPVLEYGGEMADQNHAFSIWIKAFEKSC